MERASESPSEEGRFRTQAALNTITTPAATPLQAASVFQSAALFQPTALLQPTPLFQPPAGFQPKDWPSESSLPRCGATHSPAARPTRMLAVISADRRSQSAPSGIAA